MYAIRSYYAYALVVASVIMNAEVITAILIEFHNQLERPDDAHEDDRDRSRRAGGLV